MPTLSKENRDRLTSKNLKHCLPHSDLSTKMNQLKLLKQQKE